MVTYLGGSILITIFALIPFVINKAMNYNRQMYYINKDLWDVN